MVRMIQKLCWFLNFLNHAIVPGHTFTRCMYDKLRLRNKQGRMLKAYHHVNLDVGFRRDCEMWLMFLNQVSEQNICRPFTDLSAFEYADTLQFHTDAAKKAGCGMRAVFCNEWVTRIWNTNFLMEQDPSIEFLELYALTVGVLTWQSNLVNNRFIIFCDNQAVMGMVNNMTSKCPQCMKLIRILTRNVLQCNRWILVRYIATKMNILADALSRGEYKRFWRFTPENMKAEPSKIPEEIWPIEKIWFGS